MFLILATLCVLSTLLALMRSLPVGLMTSSCVFPSDGDHLDPGSSLQSPAGTSRGPAPSIARTPHSTQDIQSAGNANHDLPPFPTHTYLPRRLKLDIFHHALVSVASYEPRLRWDTTAILGQRHWQPACHSKEWSGPTLLPKRFRLFLCVTFVKWAWGSRPGIVLKSFWGWVLRNFLRHVVQVLSPWTVIKSRRTGGVHHEFVDHKNDSPAGHPERFLGPTDVCMSHPVPCAAAVDHCYNAASVFSSFSP